MYLISVSEADPSHLLSDVGQLCPPPPKVEWRYTGFILSVCRQGLQNCLKKSISSIHLIPGIYPYSVSLMTSIHCRVNSWHQFQPSGGQIFGRKQGFRILFLTINTIRYLAVTLMGPVSWPLFIFVFLTSIAAPCWPNICQNGEVREFFFTPWPSSGQNNAGIFLKKKFSRRLPTCVVPTMMAK